MRTLLDTHVGHRIGATLSPLEHADALAVADVPMHHRDPLDHLLLATARRLAVTLTTADGALSAYGVRLLRVG